MKTYARKGITVYCIDTLEAAIQYLKDNGFVIKRERIKSFDDAVAWQKRAKLEGRLVQVIRWADSAYALGEK